MEKKVKLDLAGINLVKPTVTAASTRTSVVAVGKSDNTDTIPKVIKPKASDSKQTGSKFLEKAILNRQKSFKERLAALPQAPTVTDTEKAEEFAKAVMRGMGWREGEPCKPGGAMEATMFVPLPEGVGLGYNGKVENSRKPTYVRPVVDGVSKFTIGASESLVSNKISTGDRVSIVDGEHVGLSGILENSGTVRLDVSGIEVSVPKGHLSVYNPSLMPPEPAESNSRYCFPNGSICLMTSKRQNAHLYYHRVLVVDSNPLCFRSLDEQDDKLYSGHDHCDLKPTSCSLDDVVVSVGEDKNGVVGKLINIHDDNHVIVGSERKVYTVKAITKFHCK